MAGTDAPGALTAALQACGPDPPMSPAAAWAALGAADAAARALLCLAADPVQHTGALDSAISAVAHWAQALERQLDPWEATLGPQPSGPEKLALEFPFRGFCLYGPPPPPPGARRRPGATACPQRCAARLQAAAALTLLDAALACRQARLPPPAAERGARDVPPEPSALEEAAYQCLKRLKDTGMPYPVCPDAGGDAAQAQAGQATAAGIRALGTCCSALTRLLRLASRREHAQRQQQPSGSSAGVAATGQQSSDSSAAAGDAAEGSSGPDGGPGLAGLDGEGSPYSPLDRLLAQCRPVQLDTVMDFAFENRRYTFATYTRAKTYNFTVRAHNSAGWGPLSAATPLKAPGAGVPSTPIIANITTVNGYVEVTLAPPANQGTTTVNTYRVLGFPNGGITATNKLISVSGMGSLVPNTNKRVLKLNTHKKGLLYRWTAQAGNGAGLGGESHPRIAYLPPSVPPGAPTLAVVGALANSAGRLYVYVDFKRPTVTGDSAITYFTVRGTPAAGVTADRPLLQQTSLGVYVGGGFWRVAFYEFGRDALYRFNVRAHNQAGAGAWSNTVEFTTPDDAVPRAPALVTATVSNLATTTRVLVRVAPPTGSSGAGLTYIVTGYPDNLQLPRLNATGAGWGVSGTNQRQFAILGFVRNNIYRFTAQAVNSVGAGPERSPRVLFYQCSQYFNDTGSGCRCKVSSTGCAVKNDDRCSCKTCANTYKADGAGGCTKCPTINRCTTYSTSTCACTKCSQFFSGAACTCAVGGTGCAVKNLDGCSCKTCANTYKADGAGGCSKCPTINHCTTYSTSTCACTQCSQFFSGAACTCTVDGTNCKAKNADGCTCQTCNAGYGSDGKGGCTQCATVAKCKTYSPTDCKCTSCDQYFTVGSLGTCQCTLTGADCKLKATDGCSCQTCSDGYGSDGKGGCTKCATVAKCKTYSPTDCKCTGCDQYFTVGSLGTCQCSLTGANCAEKNLDACSCKACQNGYRPNGAGGCAPCTVDKCATYTSNTCTCTACEANYKLVNGACPPCTGTEVLNCKTLDSSNTCLCGTCNEDYSLSGDKKTCALCPDVANCAAMNTDSCQGCDTCAAEHERSADRKTCTACTVLVDNCATYSPNTCTCTGCNSGFKLEGTSCVACTAIPNCGTYDAECKCGTCETGYDKCNDGSTCVNLSTDAANCGACGKACPAGNICQGRTCMCAATGTCTVTSILPQVNYQAPPFPYRQWFARSQGEGSTITIVDLATEAGLDDNTALAVNPPGGITHAVKLVSKTPDTVTYGFAEPYVMWPPESLSGTFPRPTPAPAGMFNGVLAKTMLLSSTNRFHYDCFKSGGDSAAVAMRIRLYSPSLNKQANMIWEPAYNAAYTVVPLKTWVNVQFGKEGVVWVCGNAGAFPELGGSGYGTCDTKYKSIEYFLTTSDAGSNYKDTQFFGDAVVLGVTVMQANPGLVSYWNNLEVEYEGQALKWVFSG